MDRISFNYSTKNIPCANSKFYMQQLIAKSEKFIKNLRWRAFFYLNPKSKGEQTNTYGFNTTRSPPAIKELRTFENRMCNIIQGIQFSDTTNKFQKNLKTDIKAATDTNDVIVKADKTTNFYRMKTEDYNTLLDKNVQKNYKKTPDSHIVDINKEAKELAKQLKIDERVDTIAHRESFVTLKDHKPNFSNAPTCRLINPTKSELGKVSQQILARVVQKVTTCTNVNLWKNTKAVLDWFNDIVDKPNASFICFDIVDFYPSISEKLLLDALNFAETFESITPTEKETVIHSKKTLLFNNSKPWSKKTGPFDITMGSFDGAEACELVVCYLLKQLNDEIGQGCSMGLYRDDGLAAAHGTPRQIENIKKDVCKIFRKNGLNITIEANKKTTNFLDVTLDLPSGSHKPYSKPDNVLQYVDVKSNHPPSVIKAIPNGINKRLSEISSDEQLFKIAAPEYQTALNKSGHKFTLEYQPPTEPDTETRRKRTRKITWFNPPFDLRVKSNVGREFLKAVNECFPEGHVLRPICNKNTLKLSYSCMPNVKSIIDAHNKQKVNTDTKKVDKPCNCRNKNECPLQGQCRATEIVYQATVTSSNNQTETYIGLASTEFKSRFNNHTASFDPAKEDKRNSTELSKHIWNLREQNRTYKIKWKIIGRAKAYSNVTKKCNLCLLEKYYILCKKHMATLNKKNELIGTCRHRTKYLLKNA